MPFKPRAAIRASSPLGPDSPGCAAEGVDAGPAAPGVDLSGALVDMGHLMGVGGHRQDYGAVDARPGHGGGQAGVGGVGEGPGMTGTLGACGWWGPQACQGRCGCGYQ